MIKAIDPLISLPAIDPARAFRFYSETLGLGVVVESPETGFHIFRGPGAETPMLGVHPHEGPVAPADAQGVHVWLKVGNIEAVRSRLQEAGVSFLGESSSIGSGREVRFLDSEGNVLRLYEPTNEVTRSVEIHAPPSAVFHALTSADTIERWFCAIDDVRLDARVGGAIGFVDPVFGPVRGTVTELEPGRRIAFAFSENWPRSLAFTLEPVPAGTKVSLVQSGFDQIEERDFGIPGLVEGVAEALDTLQHVMLASE